MNLTIICIINNCAYKLTKLARFFVSTYLLGTMAKNHLTHFSLAPSELTDPFNLTINV